MRLLSFLTRKQAWLSPVEISKEFRPDSDQVSVRTVNRWFSVLREKGGSGYYRSPRDLDLLEDVEMYSSSNTHFIFSPFEELITEDGSALWSRPSDNSHFRALIRDDFRDPFEVKLSERLAENPLLIPLVVEHIWAYYSSRQVWQAIGEKDLSSVWRY